MITRVVSGGQTGVDQAALRVALDRGLEIGGYCPAGYATEAGTVPDFLEPYLTPTESSDPAERTRLNVQNSDATLVLVTSEPSGGTLLTLEVALLYAKPHLIVNITGEGAADSVREWLGAHSEWQTLNVAGPRESESPGIGALAASLLQSVL